MSDPSRFDPPPAALDRRRFLAGSLAACGVGLAAAAPLGQPLWAAPRPARPEGKNLVVVRFGAGVRFRDTFGAGDRTLTPHLRSQARRGTLFSHVRNDGELRHDCATWTLMNGTYGPRQFARGAKLAEGLSYSPTWFEMVRKTFARPVEKLLAVGVEPCSLSEEYGARYQASCFASQKDARDGASASGDASLGVCAERFMLNRRIGQIARDLDDDLKPRTRSQRRASYLGAIDEHFSADPLAETSLTEIAREVLADRLVAPQPWITAAEGDDVLLDLALRAMAKHRPECTMIAFQSTDLAHFGAWRTYTAQLRRLDLLLARLQDFLASTPFYSDRTTLVVTTEIGRGDPNFAQHELEGDSERRLFTLVLGPDVEAGREIAEPRDFAGLAPGIARFLGVPLPGATATAWPEFPA